MKSTPLTLLILAAGMGNRYGGLKQIDPVGPGGETIIDYSIYDALRAGFGKAVFVIRKDIEQAFKQAVGARFERHIVVEYVFQELDKLPSGFSVPIGRAKPWGTMQAILMAANGISEPFAVINADDFYGSDGYCALAQYLEIGSRDYAMVGFVLRNTLSDFGTVSRGVCQVNNNDFLEEVVEMTSIERDGAHAKNTDSTGRTTELSGDEMVSMNMWGFTPRVFGQLGEQFQRFLRANGSDLQAEGYLTDAVNELVLAGRARVKILRADDSWAGVTYREDHKRVVKTIRHLIDRGNYPDRLWR
jgi:dTDP-glucose pyrophosphorylase